MNIVTLSGGPLGGESVEWPGGDFAEFNQDGKGYRYALDGESLANYSPANTKADTPQYPQIDTRTGATLSKTVPRSSTYGRVAFAGIQVDVPPGESRSGCVSFPFQTDLVQGFLFADATDGSLDDTASFQIAPRTPLKMFTGGANVLASAVSKGERQITLPTPVLTAAVNSALIDAGFFQVEIEEGPSKESAVLLVTDYDETTGIVSLGIFKAWTPPAPEPQWNGFENDYSTSADIYVTRIAVSNISIIPSAATAFGSNGLDSAPVAPGVVFQVPYKNNSLSRKRVRVVLQILTGKPIAP